MNLTVEHELKQPAARLWPVLREARSLASCFPGVTLDREIDAGTYEGSIALRFGPTRATFAGQAEIEIDDQDQRGTLVANGIDRRGSSRATATAVVHLQDRSSGSVLLVDVDITVTGPLQQFAEAGGVEVTRQLLSDFVTALEAAALAPTHDRPVTSDNPPTPFASSPPSRVKLLRVILLGARAQARRLLHKLRRGSVRPPGSA